MTWRHLLRKEAGAVTTTSPSSVKGKLFNVSYSKRRKLNGKKARKEEEE
jgi:hypothetical protein